VSPFRVARRPELDPLAFPSDTTFRFVLLVLAVLGSSLFAFNVLHLTIDDQTAARRAALLCALAAGSAAERTACSAHVNHVAGAWMLGGVAVLLGVAGTSALQPGCRALALRAGAGVHAFVEVDRRATGASGVGFRHWQIVLALAAETFAANRRRARLRPPRRPPRPARRLRHRPRLGRRVPGRRDRRELHPTAPRLARAPRPRRGRRCARACARLGSGLPPASPSGRQVAAGIATAAAKNVDPMSRFLIHLVGRRHRRHPDLVARIGRYTH
jgi:hypothetical protein